MDGLLAAEEAEHLVLGIGRRRRGGGGEGGGSDLGGGGGGGGGGRRRGAWALVLVGVRRGGGVVAAADVELVGDLLHQGLRLVASVLGVRLLRHGSRSSLSTKPSRSHAAPQEQGWCRCAWEWRGNAGEDFWRGGVL